MNKKVIRIVAIVLVIMMVIPLIIQAFSILGLANSAPQVVSIQNALRWLS